MPPVQRTKSLEEVLIARDASPKAHSLSAAAPPQLGTAVGPHYSNPLYDRHVSAAHGMAHHDTSNYRVSPAISALLAWVRRRATLARPVLC